MTKNKYITLLSVILLLFMAACSDEKKDTDKSGAGQSKAVSKKIEKKIEPIQTEKDQIKDKNASETINQKTPESADVSAPKSENQTQLTEPGKTLAVKEQVPEKAAESNADELSANRDKEFDTTGKLNPFLSFVSDESEKEAEKTDTQKKKREPLTPLEKIDIGRLKLTAITRVPSGNIALVEEANGKGYVLNEGTYIGLNSGKVISVLSDRVIIEEEIENIFGKVSIQERELKLQKPTGE